MSTHSIFILKPIWDALYEDAKKDKEEMDSLKQRLAECDETRVLQLKKQIELLTHKVAALELENATLKSCAFHTVMDDTIDDAAYTAEANAPAHVYTEEKPINEVIMPVIAEKDNIEKQEESTKTIKMVGSKTKQEYQREYQRAYRKKQKNITMNI
jgi:hypothetical protein